MAAVSRTTAAGHRLTVDELRAALDGLDGALPVFLGIWTGDDDDPGGGYGLEESAHAVESDGDGVTLYGPASW